MEAVEAELSHEDSENETSSGQGPEVGVAVNTAALLMMVTCLELLQSLQEPSTWALARQ